MVYSLVSRGHVLLIRRCYTTSVIQHVPKPEPAQPPPESKVRHKRSKIPYISTLLPENLSVNEYLNWAGRTVPRLFAQTSIWNRLGNTPYVGMYYASTQRPEEDHAKADEVELVEGTSRVPKLFAHLPFPHEAKGFLYLHEPDPALSYPRYASAIRFRCVPQCPAEGAVYEAFQQGTDLTIPNGFPWNISVLLLAGRGTLSHFQQLLTAEGVYSNQDWEAFNDVYEKSKIDKRCHLVYSLNDLFPVRFDSCRITFRVPVGDYLGPLMLSNVFTDFRQIHIRQQVYTGAGHARLELSPASPPQYPQLHLRIVKITEPVKCLIPNYDGYIHPPKEGQLLMRGLPGAKQELWTLDVDPRKQAHSVLRNLL